MLLALALACAVDAVEPPTAAAVTPTDDGKCAVDLTRSCLGQPPLDALPEARPEDAINVLGEPLATCGLEPRTGWHRDGTCRSATSDGGAHVVCAEVTGTFLEATRARGNDLSRPSPAHGFPGLVPGDRWCLCASRWAEAEAEGVAPPVILEATQASALTTIPFATLSDHAAGSGDPTPGH